MERWQFLVELFGYIPCEIYIQGKIIRLSITGLGVVAVVCMDGLREVEIVFYDAQNEGCCWVGCTGT